MWSKQRLILVWLTEDQNARRSHTPTTVFLSVMLMKPMIHNLLSEVVKGALGHTP